MKVAPMTDARDLCAVIGDLRTESGTTQLQLAQALGVTRQYLIKLEQGQPTKALITVCEALRLLGYRIEVTSVKQG